MKKPCLYILLLILLMTLSGCAFKGNPSKPETRIRDGYLGTVIAISIYEQVDDSVFDEIFSVIKDIDEKMSATNPISEISGVNMAAGSEPVTVSGSVYDVVALAKQISEDSGGAFDLSIGPLVSLWNIGTENARVPPDSEISDMKKLVSYSGVLLDEEKKSVYLSKKGMELNLGGIAKGYAGDMAAEIVKTMGIENAILDLGGNIVAVGSRPDGGGWRVGIRAPVLGGGGGNVGIVPVSDKAVVTSGGYERYFEQNGEIYHHILDPFTGIPARSGLLSVTIISDSSTLADMLSTAVFVMGFDRGLSLVESYGAEAIFITEEKTVHLTDGLTESFELVSDDYSMAVR